MQSVNNSVTQFLSSFFINAQLLPQTIFDHRIDSLIEQSKSNAPILFTRFLSLIRATNHGNAIISAYGTNFEYTAAPWYNSYSSQLAITHTVTYDDGCSCALNSNCTTQAGFVQSDSSEIILIKGLKMGCTPSESFLVSTLECFYDSACINHIEEQINETSSVYDTDVPEPLLADNSRFSMNTPIIDLVNVLFIENWSTTINYSLYFDQCSPTLCSYTYIQQFNSLYTVTLLLGLLGGLTVVLRWICPKIIQFLSKVYLYRKKKTNRIQSAHTVKIVTIQTVNAITDPENPQPVTFDSELVSATAIQQYITFLLVSVIMYSYFC
jgi:hypothetical protein